MRAAVMRGSKLVIDEMPEPVPGPGEVLVATRACGICGSDLHALRHAGELVAAARESGFAPFVFDPERDVVMGHEFCAEVLDYGPGSARRLRPGTRVVAMPLLPRGASLHAVGYSNEVPGGYAERMLLSEPLLLEVPNGLPDEHAALTEPMAVGIHAVAKAGLAKGDASVVIGCGPVGLAVIAALRLRGAEPIVASDLSPTRRRLAELLGAHAVLDPGEASPFEQAAQLAPGRPAVIFECVGVPGVIDEIVRGAPPGARVVVAGVCMQDDRFRPAIGIYKELSLQFVLAYTPEEFAEALRALSEGRIEAAPLITGSVGIEGVPEAFRALERPEGHAKILVKPGASGELRSA